MTKSFTNDKYELSKRSTELLELSTGIEKEKLMGFHL